MLRMAIALPIYLGILSYIFCKKDKSKALTQTTFFSIIGLGFIGYFLASLLDLKGLETISAGLERLTLFTYPIFTAILGAIFFSTPLTNNTEEGCLGQCLRFVFFAKNITQYAKVNRQCNRHTQHQNNITI
jgi:drug/metabolite transporter (DMT)-like permease